MKSWVKFRYAQILIISLLISACGGETTLPNTSTLQSDSGKITQIISSIDEIILRIDELEKRNIVKTGTNTPKQTNPSDKTVSPLTSTDNKPAVTPSVVPKPTVNTESKESKGRKILDKVISTFDSANGIDMVYDRYEKNPANGKVRDTSIHLWARNPDTILFELLKDTTDPSKVGTKVKYNVNDTKVKARASGIVSFATVSLDFTDERMLSPNGYLINQSDILSLFKRIKSSSYSAELVGKTTLNGDEVYLLKVKTQGSNAMDSKIEYENIGFNSKDFTLRLWETYSKDSDKPFMRVTVSKIQLLSNITEEQLKL